MVTRRVAEAFNRGSWLGLAAGAVLAGGMAAAVAATDSPAPAGQGRAQMTTPAAPIPDATIGKVGAALRDIAKVRQTYTGKINATSSNDEKRGLSEQANAQAVEAIQSHGLSLQEYSSVIQTARTDPQVKQRLLEAANSSP